MSKVRHYTTIDSTNAEAHRLAVAGERGPFWIVSDEQTQGRGRLGRMWVSKPGNLYATLVLPCSASMARQSQLSFVAALAIQETASLLSGLLVKLKWPNDCLIDGRKFSGVLIETLYSGDIALGMGINVSHAPDGLPYRAAAMKEFGCVANIGEIHLALDAALQKWLNLWGEGLGFHQIRQEWTRHCGHMNAAVKVRLPEGEVSGVFVGLAEDGAMLLKVGVETRTIYVGDVVAS